MKVNLNQKANKQLFLLPASCLRERERSTLKRACTFEFLSILVSCQGTDQRSAIELLLAVVVIVGPTIVHNLCLPFLSVRLFCISNSGIQLLTVLLAFQGAASSAIHSLSTFEGEHSSKVTVDSGGRNLPLPCGVEAPNHVG